MALRPERTNGALVLAIVDARGVALLVGWAFRELGMRRIQALVHPGNVASIAVVERLGFEREGLLRYYRPGGAGERIMFAVYSSPAS